MRLPDETIAGHTRGFALALILVAALTGCGTFDGADRKAALADSTAAPRQANDPAADYPVVIGEPYRIGETLHTPADTLNHDEVGYVAADVGNGVSGAHHTLPLPSYVEVTSLETGRTILVRLERRGPMTSNDVVALSPAALEQLEASAGVPVRVRRVNPPEEERAALRAGKAAPPRMDTPSSLLAVLKRKLPQAGSPGAVSSPQALASVAVPPSSAARELPAVQPAMPGSTAMQGSKRPTPVALPPLRSGATSGSAPAPVIVAREDQPRPALAESRTVRPAATPAEGIWVVQAAALSSRERAQRLAGAIGGSVSQVGNLYRVRTGPFASRSEAEASLAKVRAAGYSDARIFTNG